MQQHWISTALDYDGSPLRSHFAYRNFGLLGDSCVAFVGTCDVKLEGMVDLMDVRRQAPIYSPRMLHFIAESFRLDLLGMILLQRLWVASLAERLHARGHAIYRRGDDLYFEERKLSVSIATRSPLSSLLHLGLNIRTEGTPVPAAGLEELGVDAAELARGCLEAFASEYASVLQASYKVRAVE